MAYAGQIIQHPTMGVTIKFINTHHETNGVGWEVEYLIDPGKGRQHTPHTHLHSDEWFQVLEGQCKYWLNGKVHKAYPGQEIYFPANTPHIHPWNYCAVPLVMRNTILVNNADAADPNEMKKIEDFFEYWFDLACCGKVKKDGFPHLLQSAVFLHAIRKHIVVAKMPLMLQDMLLKPLAFAGRLKGYRRAF